MRTDYVIRIAGALAITAFALMYSQNGVEADSSRCIGDTESYGDEASSCSYGGGTAVGWRTESDNDWYIASLMNPQLYDHYAYTQTMTSQGVLCSNANICTSWTFTDETHFDPCSDTRASNCPKHRVQMMNDTYPPGP